MLSYSSTDGILQSLNPAQRLAVQTIEGPLMTLAGPGSGKTRVVTHRIAYMIDQGIPSTSILALTFTNKAAQEMRQRIHAMIGHQRISMGTFHSFGAKFLRTYGRHVGLTEKFSIYDTDDAKRALQTAVVKAGVKLTHVSIGDLTREISRLKNRLIVPESLHEHRFGILDHILKQVYPAYQKQLIESGAVDFDDLLLYPAIILRQEPELRAFLDEKYKYVLVDEYQDTNFTQYVLIRALSIDHANVNVTGDPDQSIYGWRGANIENMLGFERDYPKVQIVRLEQNYRSTPEILSIADTLIQNNRRRKAKQLIPVRESGPKVRLITYPTDRDEANHIVDQIRTAISTQGANPRDFAILYRTNAQSRLLEQSLLAMRINYQLIGGFRFYHRQEIKDLLAYLRLVLNSRDDVAFSRVINTPTRGLGDKTIDKIAEIASMRGISMIEALVHAVDTGALSKKALSGAKEFLLLYSQLVELSSGSLVDLLKHLVDSTGYVEYLARKKAAEPDESVDENIHELLADAQQIDRQYEAGLLEVMDDVEDTSSILEGGPLQIYLEQVSLLSDADQMENDPDRVTLMTLHAAKGLEFPNVFIIAVEQDILPHIRSMDDPDQMEEERRLLFVGITRARDRLQLSTACRRGFKNYSSVPSSFLLELPRLEMEMVDLTERNYGFGDDSFEDSAFADEGFGDDSDFGSEDTDNDLEAGDDFVSETAADDAVDFSPEIIDQRWQAKQSNRKKKEIGGTDGVRSKELLSRLDQVRKIAGNNALKSASVFTPIATKAGVDVSLFEQESLVVHPDYGIGVVLSVEGIGTKRRAVIRFQSGSQKTFILASSPLEIRDS